jgi:hypothetical protein
MIDDLPNNKWWVSDIFQGRDRCWVLSDSSQNSRIASEQVSIILLARWIILRAFIDVAKEHYGGITDEVKYDWLLFQILPTIRISDVDPFLALIDTCLVDPPLEVLHSLYTMRPKEILGSDFDPSTDRFYYVLDAAQFAAEGLVGSFSDWSAVTKLPILQPIVQKLIEYDRWHHIVVSGTGWSEDHFQCAIFNKPCTISEMSFWHMEYSMGDFGHKRTQRSYMARYLPLQFLNSRSGEELQTRMYEWLRGRYVLHDLSGTNSPIISLQVQVYYTFA